MKRIIFLAALSIILFGCSDNSGWVKPTLEPDHKGSFYLYEGLTVYPLEQIKVPCKGDKHPTDVRVKISILDAQKLGMVQVRDTLLQEYLVKSKIHFRIEDYDGSRKDTSFVIERKELRAYPYIVNTGKSNRDWESWVPDDLRPKVKEVYAFHYGDYARKETLNSYLMFRHENPKLDIPRRRTPGL